mmetsp:Transcript_57539/g.153284  ORF Transcript_57539/g.153284 Transcript_57539/m.153284 type:complete len:144 (-) Transcript_57539:79-510(-)
MGEGRLAAPVALNSQRSISTGSSPTRRSRARRESQYPVDKGSPISVRRCSKIRTGSHMRRSSSGNGALLSVNTHPNCGRVGRSRSAFSQPTSSTVEFFGERSQLFEVYCDALDWWALEAIAVKGGRLNEATSDQTHQTDASCK